MSCDRSKGHVSYAFDPTLRGNLAMETLVNAKPQIKKWVSSKHHRLLRFLINPVFKQTWATKNVSLATDTRYRLRWCLDIWLSEIVCTPIISDYSSLSPNDRHSLQLAPFLCSNPLLRFSCLAFLSLREVVPTIVCIVETNDAPFISQGRC